MSKTLVIAEKPSVAQDIVRALTPVAGKFDKHDEYFENERYVVTSAVGHLVEIQAPEKYDIKRGKWSFTHLPVIPPYFDLKPVDKTKTRLNAVVKQAKRKDVSDLINACDAGREGELIFRLIEQYAFGNDDATAGRAKAARKPVKRLWLQSMTPDAIRKGFEQLRSEQQMAGLADAARSRSEADWLVGINGTRAFTAFNSRDGGFFLTTVGRVQTPTLAVVVEREEQIRKFVSRDYWEIHAQFDAAAGPYAGKWFDPQWKKNDEDAEKKADRTWTAQVAALKSPWWPIWTPIAPAKLWGPMSPLSTMHVRWWPTPILTSWWNSSAAMALPVSWSWTPLLRANTWSPPTKPCWRCMARRFLKPRTAKV